MENQPIENEVSIYKYYIINPQIPFLVINHCNAVFTNTLYGLISKKNEKSVNRKGSLIYKYISDNPPNQKQTINPYNALI